MGCGFFLSIGAILLAIGTVFMLSSKQITESDQMVVYTNDLYPVVKDGCFEAEVQEAMKGILNLSSDTEKVDAQANNLRTVFSTLVFILLCCTGCATANCVTDNGIADCFSNMKMPDFKEGNRRFKQRRDTFKREFKRTGSLRKSQEIAHRPI